IKQETCNCGDWHARLLVGVDRWSIRFFSQIAVFKMVSDRVPTNGRHPPSAAGSDRSQKTVEGGGGLVAGV
ncbi:hypothetical protein, partial [Stenotrophomonas maltophilia]|uniref:hypothetical protein n=1 Tax=Stenotrophomonas maltophilia TaxID=40324 RepID=UPI001C656A7B